MPVRYTAAPVRDTGPLPWGLLTKEEKGVIQKITALLRRIWDDNRELRKKAKGVPESRHNPWAELEIRSHRVIVIDGERGTGKTSLMLTCLAGWRNDDQRLIRDAGSKEENNEIKDCFDGMEDRVCCLQPLDFDPLPRDLPLYGWIIQAMLPLVTELEGDGKATWQHPTEGEGGKSLRERWDHLFESAIVGWGTGALNNLEVRDLEEFVMNQRDQDLSWQQLYKNWTAFLDLTLDRLERERPDVFPKDSILVLPIDDLDLQVSRARELILALRLLRHNRLVYLLTGDLSTLRQVLQLEFLGPMMKAGRLMRNAKDGDPLIDKVREISEGLAESLIQKFVSESHILPLGLLQISDALQWDQGKLADQLEGALEKLYKINFFVNRRILDLDWPCLTFRKLQQLSDTMADMPPPQRFGAFLRSLSSTDPDEWAIPGKPEESLIGIATRRGEIFPITRHSRAACTYLQRKGSEIRIGHDIEFYFWEPTPERIALDSPGLEEASYHALLALDLEDAIPEEIFVHQRIQLKPPHLLLWSVVAAQTSDYWISWPWLVDIRAPLNCVRLSRDWERLDRQQGQDGQSDPLSLIVRWVAFQFAWLDGHPLTDEKNLKWVGVKKPKSYISATGLSENTLFKRLGAKSKSIDVATRRRLAVLSAPEYGLTGEDANRWLRKLGYDKVTSDLINARELALADTVKVPHGARDWFQLRNTPPVRVEDTDITSITKLLALAQMQPESPWPVQGE